jgi:predicted RNA-binding Zn-ribbon protein involved in translation (DUF1610 family)
MEHTGNNSATCRRDAGTATDGTELNNNYQNWKCAKCGESLVTGNTLFSYLGMSFSHEALRCPKCRKVFIPRELAKGKMAEVEIMMEDK